MPIWTVKPVTEQPSVTLIRWSVFRTHKGSWHLVGFCEENQEGRVSSAVETIDPETSRAVTRSGRVYQLLGPPGPDISALYVWEIWARAKDWSYTDVTDAVEASLLGNAVSGAQAQLPQKQGDS